MEIGEALFKRLVLWQKRKRVETENIDAVFLKDMAPRLTIVARALTSAPIELLPAVNEGGWKGDTFYLPEKANRFPSLELNFKHYLYRVFFLSHQKLLQLNSSNKISQDEARKAAHESAGEVMDSLEREFVHFRKLHEELIGFEEVEDYWLYGKWMHDDTLLGASELEHTSDLIGKSLGGEITTEIESKPVEEMTTIQVDNEKQEEFTLQHYFEKIETAEEFDDIWRDFEGEDNLQNDAHALDELNLKHTVRVDDVVHSVYKADFSGQLSIAESKALKEKGFYYSYPEWNGSAGRYRKDHCRVYPLLFKSYKSDYASKTVLDSRNIIKALKRNLVHFYNASTRVNRVSHGDHFDFDQVLDMCVDIKSNVSPNENIYISKRKRRKDLSILFLIDLSLSGDSYVGGQRVIDIEKQAAIVLGEVFSEFDIDFQIDGFFSKTRNYCSYVTLKHFKDDWKKARRNVGAISPQGFTRIGPAIRHAGFLLGKQPSRSRWVILLSDGKPNDYDRYEGNYGVQDIKQALKELHQNHIESYAVAIEEEARYYLPRMFGVNHYSILTKHHQLPEVVTKLYRRIAVSA